MAGITEKSIGSFALGVATSDHVRVFAELDGQRFAIALVPEKLAKNMPDRPIKPMVEFDFQDAMKQAILRFTGAKEMGDDPNAGIKISGMLIYLAQKIGALDLDEAFSE